MDYLGICEIVNGVLGIFCTSIIIFLTVKHRVKLRTRSVYCILNIVVINLLMSLSRLNLLYHLVISLSSILYKIAKIISILIAIADFNIVGVSIINNWYTTRNNFQNYHKRVDKLFLSVAWIISFVILIPKIIFIWLNAPINGEFFYSGNETNSGFTIFYLIFIFAFMLILPVILIVFANRQMKYIEKLSNNIPLEQGVSLENEASETSNMLRKSKQSMKLFIWLLYSFMICYFPTVLILLILGLFFSMEVFIFLCVLLISSHSTVNAMIILLYYWRYIKVFDKSTINSASHDPV